MKADPTPIAVSTMPISSRIDGVVSASVRNARKTTRARLRILLIFNFCWDDAKAILMGISKFADGNWDVTINPLATAIEESWWQGDSQWDGVITRHNSAALIHQCRVRGIPLVDLHDTPKTRGVPKVRPNNVAVGHMGAEHFLELGFKHFAFCGLTEPWALERASGFVEALRLVDRECAVLETKYWEDCMGDPSWDNEQIDQIARWLADLPKPLALMACNDLRALQVARACRKVGYSVPGEIAILGANNDFLRCEFANPQLSSVATDRQLAGFRAAEILHRMMRKKVSVEDDDVRIDPVRVVVRRSTDVLAIKDRDVLAAVRYIRQAACSGISAENVAEHVGLPRYVLERKYRKLLNRSPHEEIRATQIARIKQLLAETDLPLKSIAEMAGIAHPEYVNVMFSRETGLTPGEFRRQHRPKNFGTEFMHVTEPDLREEAGVSS